MLVLSRKESDRILLPTVGVSIEVLRIRGNTTRLGIDAPDEIPILRHEIADLKAVEFTGDDESSKRKLVKLSHALRQRLSSASSALNRLYQHLEGDSVAEEFILKVFNQLQAVETDVEETMENRDVENAATVLLIEDDENERELLASCLEMNGFEINTACNCREAIDFLSIHARPDAVLLDLQKCRGDGRSFINQIRTNEEQKTTKLCALTDTDPGSLGVDVGPQGVDCWCPKPVKAEQLIEQLNKKLGMAV